MTSAPFDRPLPWASFDRPLPWTASDYLAFGETEARVELLDGSLWFGPQPDDAHQNITCNLLGMLPPAARAAGLRAVRAAKLELGPSSVALPDLVAARACQPGGAISAADVVLVGEITSETSESKDRVLKSDLYADAGIEWYLLVEPAQTEKASITARLLRLVEDHYVEDAAAGIGEALKTDDPFPFEIHFDDLLDF